VCLAKGCNHHVMSILPQKLLHDWTVGKKVDYMDVCEYCQAIIIHVHPIDWPILNGFTVRNMATNDCNAIW